MSEFPGSVACCARSAAGEENGPSLRSGPLCDHERLDVYRVALEFVVVASEVAERMPKGRAYLADQLQRAATSIVLNIAEGAGEFAPAEKARFYRIARRSATESAAVLDVCRKLNLDDAKLHAAGREHLLRIVAMLVRLCRPGTGS